MISIGFNPNIPAAQYHADKLHDKPALSSSIAQILMYGSPLQAWYGHPRLNSKFKPDNDDKFDIGTAAHLVLLEGAESSIVAVQADDWRTNKAKEEREAARSAGKVALLEHHAAAVREMVDAAESFIMGSEIADDWEKAESELTGLCDDDGVILKARFDRITFDRKIIFDYKTTTDSSPDGFSRQLIRMGYHLQEAFYRHVAVILGAPDPAFVFVAQSAQAPYECTLHACHPSLREIADLQIARAIETWRKCLDSASWPSYSGRIHYTMPTTWQMSDHEERLLEEAHDKAR